MKNFREKGEHSLRDKITCNLLKCEILYQQGVSGEFFNLAEETYNKSLELGKSILSIDALYYLARSLLKLEKNDKALNVIKQGEELLNTLTQVLPADYKQRKATLAFIKGFSYYRKGDLDGGLEFLKHSLILREDICVKKDIAESLTQIAWVLAEKGELDQSLKHAERGLALAIESKNKFCIGLSLFITAGMYQFKGEIERGIILIERSLVIFKELNNKPYISANLNSMGEIFRMRGEIDHALECLEQSLALRYEVGFLRGIAVVIDTIIHSLIEKGDIESGKKYLRDFKLVKNQLKEEEITKWYLLNKALLLKTSLRARDRVKAEEILTHLLENENVIFENRYRAILSLCELLLTELHITNDVEVLKTSIYQFLAPLIIDDVATFVHLEVDFLVVWLIPKHIIMIITKSTNSSMQLFTPHK